MAETQVLDLDTLCNETLDNIEEAADFQNPPAGEYNILVNECKIDKYSTKEGEAKQRIKITYSVLETISIASDEPPVPNGTLFTETFTATEQGLSFFKKRAREVMDVSDTAGVTLGDMMSSIKGASFTCRVSIKKSPKPGGGDYENIQIRVVKPAA